ncbi:MAG TPA: hydrogenase, partial [Acidobacteriota bacterium]|nr:hydrogenase [Acidobacteriota bacterium]
LASIAKQYAGNGEGLAFLADESASPTRARLVAALKAKFPRAIWAEYEPVADEAPADAAVASFGQNVKPIYRFAQAKRVLSLDADFFHAEGGCLEYARAFSKGRRVAKKDDPMNRLYVVESAFTLTGSMADHRLRLGSSQILAFAAALAGHITGNSAHAALVQGLGDVNPKWIEECAKDLAEHRGESIVVAGAHQPAAVHVLVNAINQALGNIGKTVQFVAAEPRTASTIQALAAAIKAGSVKTLFVLNGNPAYNAPADLEFGALLKSVPDVIRFGYYADETAALAGTTLAATHYLESWSDGRTLDGTIVPIQPMILPLFGGLMEVELLARLAGEQSPDAYAQVFATIGGITGGDKKAFEKFLHDGVLANSAYKPVAVTFNAATASALVAKASATTAPAPGNLEVRFATDHKLDDGRFANNGWLQECPDPITKISWDNAILISPRLAKELKVYPHGSNPQVARVENAEYQQGKEVAYIGEVEVNGRKVTGPIHIQPGLANYTIILPLGYGRTHAGRVGTAQGFNAYTVRTSDTMGFATGVKLKKTGATMKLANTQEHWSMEGRDIVREANLDEFAKNPAFVAGIGMESHTPPVYGKDQNAPLAVKAKETQRGQSLYEHPNFDGIHQWGMSIDLNTCIGCNACVVAC